MSFPDGRYVVTGAAGFIGSHLVDRLLESGAEVVAVDCVTDYYDPAIKYKNLGDPDDREGLEFLERDILDVDWPSLLPEVDGLFHQAAHAGVRASWGTEFDGYVDQNIRATQRLLEHVKTSAPELPVVVASSSSVYGIPEELPMEEEMKPRPYSPYGVTKLASENLAMLYHQNFDLNTVALRYFTVYGPRQRPDMAITRFLGWIKQGFTIPIFGDGSQSRDFTYVSDIVDANLTIVEEDVYGSVFNVGGGRRATLNEVIDLLESITGRAVDREYDETQEGDVPHTDADTSKIRSKTSWDPDVGLEEGLRRQWEWLRDNEVVLEVLEEIQEDPTQ